MRITTDQWIISGGAKMGFDHLASRTNCHDAFSVKVINPYIVGVICDGCGSGAHSEVGANLMAQYTTNLLADAIYNRWMPDIPRIAPMLFRHLIKFVQRNISEGITSSDPLSEAAFINDYWLCTILGFIIAPEKTLIFYAGDGSYRVNDIEQVIVSPNNAPQYLAYNCVSNDELLTDLSVIPKQFETETFMTNGINRLMIASDGFLTDRKWVREFDSRRGTWGVKNDDDGNPLLLSPIQGQQWGLRGETGINRFLNQKADMGYFTDDVALITVERQEECA